MIYFYTFCKCIKITWQISHHFLTPSSWAPESQRWRKRCECPLRWPWPWVSRHRARCACPPWPSEAGAAQRCCQRHVARQRSTSECAEAPRGRRDPQSGAGQQGRRGQSKVAEANCGEGSTWREGEKERLEGKVRGKTESGCYSALIRWGSGNRMAVYISIHMFLLGFRRK